MKKPSELFRDAYKRSVAQPYQTKFKQGDVVMNVQYGVISLVVNILTGHEYKVNPAIDGGAPIQIQDAPVQYELKDIKNDKTKRAILNKPSRYQHCQTIDKYYELVNPVTARLLYGVG